MKSHEKFSRYLIVGSLLTFIATGIVGCASISTGAHYDETANFSTYKSFTWISEQPMISAQPDSGQVISPLTQAKIQQAIQSGFEQKGYTFVSNRDQADIVIAYTVGTRQEIRIDSYPAPYYGPWGWHVRGSHYYVREYDAHSYTMGTLGVDVFDAATKQPVWHGWAEKSVTSGDRKDPTQVINAAVEKMLESFPQ